MRASRSAARAAGSKAFRRAGIDASFKYSRLNLALHPEYSYRKQNSAAGDITENFFTARLDYAF